MNSPFPPSPSPSPAGTDDIVRLLRRVVGPLVPAAFDRLQISVPIQNSRPTCLILLLRIVADASAVSAKVQPSSPRSSAVREETMALVAITAALGGLEQIQFGRLEFTLSSWELVSLEIVQCIRFQRRNRRRSR